MVWCGTVDLSTGAGYLLVECLRGSPWGSDSIRSVLRLLAFLCQGLLWRRRSFGTLLCLAACKPRLAPNPGTIFLHIQQLPLANHPSQTGLARTLTKNKNGSGMHAAARNANTLDAQCTPKLLYIAGLISGKTAASAERSTTVDAMALAQ